MMKKYSLRSRMLHWLIAFLAIALLAGGFFGQTLPVEQRGEFYAPHKSIGLTLLALMAFRIYAVRADGYPELPEHIAVWQKKLARAVQYGLYLLLLLQPLSGWIMTSVFNRAPMLFGFGPVSFPFVSGLESVGYTARWIHGFCPWVLISFMVLHVAGSIKHYFIDRDDVVQKML